MTYTLFGSDPQVKQATRRYDSLRRVIDVYSDFIVIIFLGILYFSLY